MTIKSEFFLIFDKWEAIDSDDIVYTYLLKWLIAKAPEGQKFFLDVECQNIPAIELYKKIGFEFVSIRKGYYPQLSAPALDAFVMTYQKLPKPLS
jgi:ribosomal protein S18 acetylase RimI-like enzyme